MKRLHYLILLSIISFISCTNEMTEDLSTLPDAQIYMTDMVTTDIQTSRSNGVQTVNNISFHDSISGNDYNYTLYTYSDSIATADLNCDGIEDLHMLLKENKIIGTMGGYVNELNYITYMDGNNLIYEFSSNPVSRVSYKHLSWWECCTRLAATGDVAMIALITGAAAPVAAAIAVVCLDDRNRWEVVE